MKNPIRKYIAHIVREEMDAELRRRNLDAIKREMNGLWRRDEEKPRGYFTLADLDRRI